MGTVLYYTVLYCTVLYSTILYCTVLYIGIDSHDVYFLIITANFLERNNRGDRSTEEDEERNDNICRQAHNQSRNILKTEATLSTVVCGSSGSGTIKKTTNKKKKK